MTILSIVSLVLLVMVDVWYWKRCYVSTCSRLQLELKLSMLEKQLHVLWIWNRMDIAYSSWSVPLEWIPSIIYIFDNWYVMTINNERCPSCATIDWLMISNQFIHCDPSYLAIVWPVCQTFHGYLLCPKASRYIYTMEMACRCSIYLYFHLQRIIVSSRRT
jgi:hypothetical protein